MGNRVTVTVDDTDPGFKNLRARAKGTPFVDIGLFEEDPEEVVMRAWINEFGSFIDNIPQRSFFRSAIDEKKKEIILFIEKIELDYVFGKISLEVALTKVGEFGKKLIRNKMERGPFKGNAPQTIARKGFDKPLFETSEMFNLLKIRVGKQL